MEASGQFQVPVIVLKQKGKEPRNYWVWGWEAGRMGVGGTSHLALRRRQNPRNCLSVYLVLESTTQLTNPKKLIRHTQNGEMSCSICTIHWTCLHTGDITTENCRIYTLRKLLHEPMNIQHDVSMGLVNTRTHTVIVFGKALYFCSKVLCVWNTARIFIWFFYVSMWCVCSLCEESLRSYKIFGKGSHESCWQQCIA